MEDEETKVVNTEEETAETLDPTALLMGYRMGQSLRQLRMEN